MAPRAYYNENDRRAAAWLRWLIRHGYLPEGVVDERSIRDVQPGDLRGFAQCHFFAGIGGWPLAALLAGWPADRPLWTGSCPCQPFSAAGRREGADDARHLWPDFFRLIEACRPAVVVGEQVSGALGYGWFDGVAADLGGADYACQAVDAPAAAVDSPQIRQRLWWVAMDRTNRAGCDELAPGGLHAGGSPGADDRRPDGAGAANDMASSSDQGQDGLRPRGSPDGPCGRRHGDGDAQGPMASPPGLGGERGPHIEERRPQGRAAASGDDEGERPGSGALVDAESDGRRERFAELQLQRRGRPLADADGPRALDGSEGGGLSPAGREQVQRPAQAQPERRDGGRMVDSKGDDRGSGLREGEQVGHGRGHPDANGLGLGSAECRRLEIRELAGWDGGSPRRWIDASGADERNGSWWSGAEWLVCHDGKARRVPDARAPLLAPRFPGRVAAWSGVGNAICVPQAVEVLAALLEVIDDPELLE